MITHTHICICCRDEFQTLNPAQHCCDDCERGPDEFDERKSRIEDALVEKGKDE